MKKLLVRKHEIYDKNGYPIRAGDVLKIFHFVAALRREKKYMYKLVDKRINNTNFFVIRHLSFRGNYYLFIDDSIKNEIEIVQGRDSDFRDRQRLKKEYK